MNDHVVDIMSCGANFDHVVGHGDHVVGNTDCTHDMVEITHDMNMCYPRHVPHGIFRIYRG
jgi:hypothetical protein